MSTAAIVCATILIVVLFAVALWLIWQALESSSWLLGSVSAGMLIFAVLAASNLLHALVR